MRTRVKICGVTNLEDALAAVELGADALGFNFFPPSPRYVSPQQAAEIIQELPAMVSAVGVFAGEEYAKKVREIAETARVDSIQLHGPRTAPAELLGRYRLIRAFQVGPDFDLSGLSRYNASAFLLDGFSKDRLGGTGRTFDWSVARAAKRYGSILLAGGLTPENVCQAVRAVHPFAVDVAGGVEACPGKKDRAKLAAFMAAVRWADEDSSPCLTGTPGA